MIEHKYSTFWPRFWAGFVDGLIFVPLNWIYPWAFVHSPTPLRVVVFVVNASAILIYDIWMLGRFGQTLGKMCCRVVVLDVSEGRLSYKQAALRDIFGVATWVYSLVATIPRIISGVDITALENFTSTDWALAYCSLAWFALELLTMFTNNKRRSLHDFIAGSVVIRKTSKVIQQAPDAGAAVQ